MRFLRNPNITVAVLAVYTAIMYIVFMPKNNEMSIVEKCIIGAVSVGVLALLWVLLRRREKLRREREREMKDRKDKLKG